MTPVLADSSFFVALYNQRESSHRRCFDAYQTVAGPLITCEACLTETFHLLEHAAPVVDGILASIEQGTILLPVNLGDHPSSIRELMRKYADTPVDFADACLIHMANELGTGDILTLDSDFRHYRWRRNRRFNMLIPLA